MKLRQKPENVGFNIRDDIVLFDFGLAREIDDKDKVSDGTWKLTGETGSLRYMAPEVSADKPYGKNFIATQILWVFACFKRGSPFSYLSDVLSI